LNYFFSAFPGDYSKIQLEITDLKNGMGEAAGTRVMFGIPVGK
jgi:hypothetical protein